MVFHSKVSVFLLAVAEVLVIGLVIRAQSRQVSPPDVCQHLESARIYAVKDDIRAEDEFKAALSDGRRKCAEASLELSRYYSRRLRFAEAAKAIQHYVARTPRKNHRDDLAELRDLQTASSLMQYVDSSSKPSLNALLSLTRFVIRFGQKQRPEGVTYAERSINLYPDSVEALLLYASVLRDSETATAKKLQVLDRAVTLDPQNSVALSTRGWLYLDNVRNLERAEDDFRRALTLSHNQNPDAWKGLGYVLMERGQRNEAVDAFRKYIHLRKSTERDSEIESLIANINKNSGKN